MAVEDALKPSLLATADNPANPSPRPNSGSGRSDVEEGEIIGEHQGGSDDAAAGVQSGNKDSEASQTHPLENSWTFWFDNPSAKQKQAAWGASMRPVYTFSTVEEFWR